MKYVADGISQMGTIMGIWAHPDDEAWMSAGVMAAAAAAKQRVVCVTATNGEGGQVMDSHTYTPTQIGRMRQHELVTSLHILGVSEHYCLNYPDGMLSRIDPTKPIQTIAAIINEVKPRVILTFGADGFTGHMDHRTIFTWAQCALQLSGEPAELWLATEATEKYYASGRTLHSFANFYCNTQSPFMVGANEVDVYFQLPATLLQKKIAALKAHKSQTRHIFADRTAIAALYAHAQEECFMKAA